MLFILCSVSVIKNILSYLFLSLLISDFLVIKLDVSSKDLSNFRDKRSKMSSPIEFYPLDEFLFLNICQYGGLNIFTVFDDTVNLWPKLKSYVATCQDQAALVVHCSLLFYTLIRTS